MGNARKKGKTSAAADHDSDRRHLTGREVEKLIEAAKGGRNEARDRCLLLLMFRHGFRVSEACRLKRVERCSGLRCSLTKNVLPALFIRARSFSHAFMASSSSLRSGCVVDNPRFSRVTCSTRLSVST
jgi:Phage integrase family